jgi:hypothetical protein
MPSQEEHRTLVELSRRLLLSATDPIEHSRALLAQIEAKFSGTTKRGRRGDA